MDDGNDRAPRPQRRRVLDEHHVESFATGHTGKCVRDPHRRMSRAHDAHTRPLITRPSRGSLARSEEQHQLVVADPTQFARHVGDEALVAGRSLAHGVGVDAYAQMIGVGHGFTRLATMAPPGESPNVLLVTVDCLRRDRLSAYGYERRTTPFLDSLLGRALHCTSAHSAAPWTAPSVASLLTGLYPHSHGAGLIAGEPKNLTRENLPTSLPRGVPVLGDLLPGHAAGAFVGVWNAALPLEGRLGHAELLEKSAPKLTGAALRWMNAQSEPFLCWVHMGETHDPLEVPKHLRQTFGPVSYRSARRWAFTKAGDDVSTDAFHEYRDERVRLYDAAALAADEAIAALWEGLGAKRDRTILCVTSDHGEEMWEHREEEAEHFADPRGIVGVGHGHNLFQVHLIVPLIFSGPGMTATEVRSNASLVDVVPTLLAAAGAAIPSALDGVSLLEDSGERPILAEGIAYGHAKKTVILGDDKLLSSPLDGYERASTLGRQRTETGVLDDPARICALRALLPPDPDGGAGQSEAGRVAADEEIAGHLRDLGYIE